MSAGSRAAGDETVTECFWHHREGLLLPSFCMDSIRLAVLFILTESILIQSNKLDFNFHGNNKEYYVEGGAGATCGNFEL